MNKKNVFIVGFGLVIVALLAGIFGLAKNSRENTLVRLRKSP